MRTTTIEPTFQVLIQKSFASKNKAMEAKKGFWDENVVEILFLDKKDEKRENGVWGNIYVLVKIKSNAEVQKRVKCGGKSNMVTNESLDPFWFTKSLNGTFR